MSNLIKNTTKTLVWHPATNVTIFMMIVACLFAYIYFANEAVRTVTLLEDTKSVTQNLSVKVSEMESKRLALEDHITLENAQKLGFVEISDQNFIVHKAPKTASLNF